MTVLPLMPGKATSATGTLQHECMSLGLSGRSQGGGSDASVVMFFSSKPKRVHDTVGIRFDRATAQSLLDLENSVVGKDSFVLSHADEIRQMLSLHTSICRIMSFDPSNFGLVVGTVRDSGSNWGIAETDLDLYSDSLDDYTYGVDTLEHVLRDAIRIIPIHMRKMGYGWFANARASATFGALYLAPVARLDVVNNTYPAVEGWVLQQSGLEEANPLGYALWNDHDGLERLITHVLSMSPDAALSLRALGDDESCDVRELRWRHELSQVIEEAREALRPEIVLRPILVTRAVNTACEELPGHYLESSEYHPVWQQPMTTASVSRHVSPKLYGKEVARRMLPTYPLSDDVLDALAPLLKPHLAERDLGTPIVTRIYDSQKALFVVRDVEFFTRYLPAFGVLTGTPLQVY